MADRYHEAGKRLDEWEQTAKAATPGPWHAQSKVAEDLHFGAYLATCVGSSDRELFAVAGLSHADAEHMATFDPATMLRLIKALRYILIAFASPRDTDRIIDAILGSDE